MQREFFDNLAKELRFQELSDWYKVTAEDIIEYGGSGLLAMFKGKNATFSSMKGSPMEAIKSAYPRVNFQQKNIRGTPSNFEGSSVC